MSGLIEHNVIDEALFAKFEREQEITFGENAPDSEVSVIKVVKEVLGGAKNGADVTNIVLPASVLDPVSSLEKGMKAMQRGELVPQIMDMTTPQARFEGILRYFFSGLPIEKFGKKPYNPILGEVFRCGFQHKDKAHGMTYLTCEQVSHHPPVTALHINNPTLGFELNSVNRPEPRFFGNYLEIRLSGIVRVYLHKHGEEYHITRPTVYQSGLLGIGNKRVELIGTAFLCCEKSNLLAVIDFKGKGFLGMSGTQHSVGGSIRKLDTDEVLYEIDGVWDQQVTLKSAKTGEKRILFDFDEEVKKNSMKVWIPEEKDLEENNSLVVWKKCSSAIWKKDAKGANDEKKAVEESQRKMRKLREEKKKPFVPVYFEKVTEDTYYFKNSLMYLIPGAATRGPELLSADSPLRTRTNSAGNSPKTTADAQGVSRRFSRLLKGGLK